MEFAKFETLLKESLFWNKIFRLIVDKEFIEKGKREAQLINLSLREKYLEFISENKSFYKKIPKNQIALYLNVTPQSLSRMLSKELK